MGTNVNRSRRAYPTVNCRSFYSLLCTMFALLAISSFYPVVGAIALERPEQMVEGDVGIFTQLGTKVDLSRRFTRMDGTTSSLAELAVPGKPLVIVPVYYKCPRLCGLLLDGVSHLLNNLSLGLGKDFSVLVVSFDPSEGASDAQATFDKFKARLNVDVLAGAAAFPFLVGDAESVSELMKEIGFRYQPDGKDFAHSAAITVLTPGGEISQYFTGIEFSPWDVRLALIDASKGGIGTAIDHLLLYCFRFDPLQGKYTWAVVNTLRVGGALTLLGLAAVYLLFVRGRSVGT